MTAPQLTETNQTIKRALALASEDPRQALNLLEQGLKKCRAREDRQGVHSVARNAGVVCASMGELARALAYYGEALSVAPEDASLHLACGDLHRRLGQRDEAATAFALGLEKATEQGDVETIAMASKAQADLDDDEPTTE